METDRTLTIKDKAGGDAPRMRRRARDEGLVVTSYHRDPVLLFQNGEVRPATRAEQQS